MIKQNKAVAFFVVAMLALGLLVGGCQTATPDSNNEANSNTAAANQSPNGMIVGGQCDYDYYPGQCVVQSIEQNDDSRLQGDVEGGPGYAGYAVEFKFDPDKPGDVEGKKGYQNMNHLMMVHGSWYPSDGFIQKNKITVGASFGCQMGLITSGTCTPQVFQFDTIDLNAE